MRLICLLLISLILKADFFEIKIPSDLEEKSIKLFIISHGKTSIQKNFKTEKKQNNLFLNFEALSDDKLSLVAKKISGETFTLPVLELAKSSNELEVCIDNVDLSNSSIANLNEINQIRTDSFKHKDDKLLEILTPEFLELLSKREVSYGFKYEQPLSLETNLEELTLRLYKLETVTRNIRER